MSQGPLFYWMWGGGGSHELTASLLLSVYCHTKQVLRRIQLSDKNNLYPSSKAIQMHANRVHAHCCTSARSGASVFSLQGTAQLWHCPLLKKKDVVPWSQRRSLGVPWCPVGGFLAPNYAWDGGSPKGLAWKWNKQARQPFCHPLPFLKTPQKLSELNKAGPALENCSFRISTRGVLQLSKISKAFAQLKRL